MPSQSSSEPPTLTEIARRLIADTTTIGGVYTGVPPELTRKEAARAGISPRALWMEIKRQEASDGD